MMRSNSYKRSGSQSNAEDMLDNPLFKECISLATNSKSDHERYGSLVVKGGEIIGRGFNRCIASAQIHLDRVIRQGYANHAEVEAMNDALMAGHQLAGAEIFCAGFLPKGRHNISMPNRLMIRDGPWYTCARCLPHMENYGIGMIHVPTIKGWSSIDLADAAECAKLFIGGTHEKRIAVVATDYSIEDIVRDNVG